MKRVVVSLAAVFAIGMAAVVCAQEKAGGEKLLPGIKSLPLGLIAKSQSNPVFQAAKVGAEDAAKEWTTKLGIPVTVDWRTPTDENAQKQAEVLDQLVNKGVR